MAELTQTQTHWVRSVVDLHIQNLFEYADELDLKDFEGLVEEWCLILEKLDGEDKANQWRAEFKNAIVFDFSENES